MGKRLGRGLLWTFILLVVLFGADQLLVRVPAGPSWYAAVRTFYTDFRSRLLHPVFSRPPSVKTVIDRAEHSARVRPATKEAAPRYLYVDTRGQLQFAATLEQIPPALRKGAKRLAR